MNTLIMKHSHIKFFFLILWIGFVTNAQAVEVDQYPALQKLVKTMIEKDGFTRSELDSIFSMASIDQKTIELMDRQYESLPWYKYRKLFINQNRIEMGVKFWDTYQSILERAEREYGIPQQVIVALIGVETHYGTRLGDKSVLDSLVTLSAAYERRSKFFSSELRTFLKMTRQEKIDPTSVVGSFAGAIGIPQFMPTSYEAYSVDFNGNQQRDLVNEVDDAIGSVANYLSVHGWQRNKAIYATVTEPLSQSGLSLVGRKAKLVHTIDSVVNAGVAFDSAGGSDKVSLISFKNENHTRYIVGFRNFYAITRYNPSVNYALAVSELSEAISKLRNK